MRVFYALSVVLLLSMRVSGQSQSFLARYPNNYFIVSVSPGMFFPSHPGHDISANFPYTTASTVTGVRETHQFDGAVKNKFSNPLFMLGGTLESILKHHDIVIGGGVFQMNGGDHGYYLQAGYRYVIHAGGLDLKPGVDVYYLSGVDRMGSIDNHQQNIYLPGYTAYDQFTIKESETYTDSEGENYTSTRNHTYDAERLDVNYRRISYLTEPKVAVTAHYRKLLSFGLELGYMIQVSQVSRIGYEQVNHAASRNYTVGKQRLDQNGVLSGPHASVKVGVNL